MAIHKKIFNRLSIESVTELLNLRQLISKIARKLYFYHKTTSIRGLLFLLIMYFTRKIDYFEEFNYWNGVLLTIPELNLNERKKLFPKEISKFLSGYKKGDDAIKVLDVGSGPTSILAWGVQQNLFQVTAVDPLADVYRALLKKHNISYPIIPEKGYGEYL